MHKDDIPYVPCDQPFADMPVDATGTLRHCKVCDKQVHDLSALPRAQARAIVEDRQGRCICFGYDASGRVRFADDPPLRPSKLRGRPRVRVELAVAALLASLFAIGCGEPETIEAAALELDSPEPRVSGAQRVVPWAEPVESPCPPEPAVQPAPPEPAQAKPRRRKQRPRGTAKIKLDGGGSPLE